MSTPAKRSGALLVLGGAVLLAAVVIAMLLLTREDTPIVAPPTPSPSASPTPAPVVQPTPFKVKLAAVGVQEMGNGRLYRRRAGNTRKGATQHARAAVRELRRYLNGVLVDPATRFKPGPVNRLLTGRAEAELNRKGRRALGVGAPPIEGGRTRRATAKALVLYDGKRAHAVTVRYRARLNVLVPGAEKRQPLRQIGVMVFIPTKNGWRADMVDVRTALPRRATAEQPEDVPSPEDSPS